MGLLKSVDNVPGIDFVDYRDSLYYNKYEFRMRVKIPCVKYTWYCKKPEDLDTKLQGKFNNWGNVRKEDVNVVRDNLTALKALVTLQKEKKKRNIGIRIESNTVAVFSDDLNSLKSLESILGITYSYDYTQVETNPYAGVKYFVNDPAHKYRVYLKSKKVSDTFHIELRDTIQRVKSLYPSGALKRWLSNDGKRYGIWYFRWTSSAHFIDYDDESTLSYIALMHGDVLGKKYKLEKRPDTI